MFCADHALAPYMAPRAMVTVPALERNAKGKVNKKRLLATHFMSPESVHPHVQWGREHRWIQHRYTGNTNKW